MKPFKTLYLKELKTIIIPSFLLAVTYGFLTAYFSLTDITIHRSTFEFAHGIQRTTGEFPNLMLYSALIVLPIMLSYSLYIEWSIKTSHQLLTLPVPRYTVMLGKYLAVASVGIALVIVITVFQHIYEVRLLAEFPKRLFVADPFIFAFSGIFSILWLLGMVSLVYALLVFLRRLDLWVGLVLFGVVFVFSVWSLNAMKPFLYYIFGIDELIRVFGYGMYRNEYAGLLDIGWLFVLGSLYLFAGLYLFHHRGES